MPIDWRTAYSEQAKSDFSMFNELKDGDTPFCHQLHYLQMATEKLAKAYLTPTGSGRYQKVHNAFVRFIRTAGTMPGIMNAAGFSNREHYQAYLRGLLEKAHLVEDLSPEGEDHPNPEYPWQTPNGIETPLRYGFDELQFHNPKMIKLLHFVTKCIESV